MKMWCKEHKGVFKKSIYILMMVVFMSNIVGCSKLTMYEGKFTTYEDSAKEQLEKKYNKSFVIKRMLSKNRIKRYCTVVAYDEEKPNLPFLAYVDIDGEGISDTYVSRRVCEKISNKVTQNIGDLDGTYFITSTAVAENGRFSNPEMTIEEYVDESSVSTFHVYMGYCPENGKISNQEQLYMALSNAFNGMGDISGWIHVYIVDEGNLQYMKENAENNADYNVFIQSMDLYFMGYANYENGKLVTEKTEIMSMLDS